MTVNTENVVFAESIIQDRIRVRTKLAVSVRVTVYKVEGDSLRCLLFCGILYWIGRSSIDGYS